MVHQWMWPNSSHPGKHTSQVEFLISLSQLQTCLREWGQLQSWILERQLQSHPSNTYHYKETRGRSLQENISQEGKEVSECEKHCLWSFEYFPFINCNTALWFNFYLLTSCPVFPFPPLHCCRVLQPLVCPQCPLYRQSCRMVNLCITHKIGFKTWYGWLNPMPQI